MIVKNLKLENFRNYEKLDLDFANGINLIYGKNGQGKTNIIEAIYFFAVARSYRVLKDKDMIRYEMPYSVSQLEFSDNLRDFDAKSILFRDKNREIYLNNIKTAKNSELIGNFNAVLFSPEDFSIIKDGPSERRRFLDIAISQVKPNYFHHLVEYQKIIKMKNKVLKEQSAFDGMIDIYNEKLAEIGAVIINYRYKFFEFAKDIAQKYHREITLSMDKLLIKYDCCVEREDKKAMERKILKKLNSVKQREMYEGFSIFGPHRDDIAFFINGNRVKEFASQGQQRTVILILKLIQADYIEKIKGEYPVLLLDDILSELDSTRKKYILNEIKNKQVIITATEKGSFARRKNTKLIQIENGKII